MSEQGGAVGSILSRCSPFFCHGQLRSAVRCPHHELGLQISITCWVPHPLSCGFHGPHWIFPAQSETGIRLGSSKWVNWWCFLSNLCFGHFFSGNIFQKCIFGLCEQKYMFKKNCRFLLSGTVGDASRGDVSDTDVSDAGRGDIMLRSADCHLLFPLFFRTFPLYHYPRTVP